jgi:electron transfer flavoprotein alpha subunit
VIVFLEPPGARGDEINRGILSEGRRVASAIRGALRAVSVGVSPPEPRTLKTFGVSTLYSVESDDFAEYDCGAFSWAALDALRSMSFRLLLFADSDRGSELAPSIAAGLESSAVTDCTEIRIRDDKLVYVRHLYNDQLEQEVSYRDGQREVVAMRVGNLETRSVTIRGPLEVWSITAEISTSLRRARILETLQPDPQTVDIAFARRIVAAGAGCRDVLSLVEELAGLLDASMGTTRVLVDEGHIPKSRMIGQTGKNVAPEKYMALGVSGSPHHVAGIQQSGEILAVNMDPAAPVFDFADKGFVGDLVHILPRLIERIQRYRNEGLS